MGSEVCEREEVMGVGGESPIARICYLIKKKFLLSGSNCQLELKIIKRKGSLKWVTGDESE